MTPRDVAAAALKEQLLDAEQQLEQERSAHSQVVKASTDREHELQQEMAQSAAVLSRMQRQLDERNSRIVGEQQDWD